MHSLLHSGAYPGLCCVHRVDGADSLLVKIQGLYPLSHDLFVGGGLYTARAQEDLRATGDFFPPLYPEFAIARCVYLNPTLRFRGNKEIFVVVVEGVYTQQGRKIWARFYRFVHS
jgi:hypothetical protein